MLDVFRRCIPLLRRKAVTGKMSVWLLNVVVFPSALYRRLGFVPTPTTLNVCNSMATGLIKRKLGLPVNHPNAVLFDKSFIGLQSFPDLVLSSRLTDILAALNDTHPRSIAIKVSLCLLQRHLSLPFFPLSHPLPITVTRSRCWFGNLLSLMHARRISVSDSAGDFFLPYAPHIRRPLGRPVVPSHLRPPCRHVLGISQVFPQPQAQVHA